MNRQSLMNQKKSKKIANNCVKQIPRDVYWLFYEYRLSSKQHNIGIILDHKYKHLENIQR